jgi:hypothetical protein
MFSARWEFSHANGLIQFSQRRAEKGDRHQERAERAGGRAKFSGTCAPAAMGRLLKLPQVDAIRLDVPSGSR